jgi:sulfite reductase (NADPH) flavoprotein alpha-component
MITFPTVEPTAYSRRNPFPAALVGRALLSDAREPNPKHHYEIALEGSGLRYEPGDSLAIFPENDPGVVEAILARFGWNGGEEVLRLDGQASTLRQVLLSDVSITKTSRRLRETVEKLRGTMPTICDVSDLLSAVPEVCASLTPRELVASLDKLQPRLYSIASSMREHGEVAHLFVSSVFYESCGHRRRGVCTGYLANRVPLRSEVPVFVHSAPYFHMPLEPDASVIMIGAGTGVAPFRAFLEERRALGCRGRNWLFFGQRHEARGFYYREDWLELVRCGVLTRLDTAFSPDQPERLYVQHRMMEHAPELWRWLNDGAYIYLCGDARLLAPDVDATLTKLAIQCGSLSPREAALLIQNLRTTKRYRRDVY